jgi:hypothetical protein
MGEYTVKYEMREPKSRNPKSGSVSYSSAVPSTVTVNAANESEARKKAAKHPKVIKARERVNARIPETVQNAGGKARFKVNTVTRGGGGGAMLNLNRLASGTDMPKMKNLKRGGPVRKK